MFRTFKSRLAVVLSGALLLGAYVMAGRAEEFWSYAAVGLIAVWGGVYGIDWALAGTNKPDAPSFVLPNWARYAILILLTIFVMGLPRVISRLIG
jgi:hypothetical protein